MTAPDGHFPRPGWITLRTHRLPLSVRLDRRVLPALAVLAVALLLVMSVSIVYGDYNIRPDDVLRALLGLPTDNANHLLVVRTFRLPRILMALLIGVALAVSGAIMQGITRNDLADPGLLGINAGAGVFVTAYLVAAAAPNPALMPWLAFAGALGASALIYVLAWRGAGSTMRLILIGIGIASLGSALISYFLTRLTVVDAQRAFLWLTGSIYSSTWGDIRLLATWIAILLPIALLQARHLNVLYLGEDLATGLGARTEFYRLALIAISAGLAAITVTVAGTIGFVGIVAPHIARRLVGPAHEGLLICAALVGGLLLVTADLIARWAPTTTPLPIGVMTAIIGAPYFAWLLYRRGH